MLRSLFSAPAHSVLAHSILALSLLTTSLAAPALAAPVDGSSDRPALVRACLSEAAWSVRTSSAYVNGSPRQREVLRNGYAPGVTSVSTLCRAFETAAPSARASLNAQCQAQANMAVARKGAKAHAERLSQVCQALAG